MLRNSIISHVYLMYFNNIASIFKVSLDLFYNTSFTQTQYAFYILGNKEFWLLFFYCIIEEFVQYIVQRTLKNRAEELRALERDVTKLEPIKGKFPRLHYNEAVEIILKENPNFPEFEGWDVSFAAFTYNLNDKQTIIDYIKNQKEHHKTVSFEEEYRNFLIENGIEIDERYFLKD